MLFVNLKKMRIWGFDVFKKNRDHYTVIFFWGKFGTAVSEANKREKEFKGALAWFKLMDFLNKKVKEKCFKGYKKLSLEEKLAYNQMVNGEISVFEFFKILEGKNEQKNVSLS